VPFQSTLHMGSRSQRVGYAVESIVVDWPQGNSVLGFPRRPVKAIRNSSCNSKATLLVYGVGLRRDDRSTLLLRVECLGEGHMRPGYN
jgi:hypothetical protein